LNVRMDSTAHLGLRLQRALDHVPKITTAQERQRLNVKLALLLSAPELPQVPNAFCALLVTTAHRTQK